MTDPQAQKIANAAKRLKLISTDFDGTLYAEHDPVPIAPQAESLLTALQSGGAVWVINTGRDLSSLIEAIGRSGMRARPDYMVVVEREIYEHDGAQYVAWEEWNRECGRAHRELFARMRRDLPALIAWMEERFTVTVYEDPYSPMCVIASSVADTDSIQEELDRYARGVEGLVVVRNDVYVRFSHVDYNKGRALAAIAAKRGIAPAFTVAAGDHYNDTSMLDLACAGMLIAPANAIPEVKALVRSQGGYVSSQICGRGVARGLESLIETNG